MESINPTPQHSTGWFATSGAFFLHFLSLGFAVFPLQTHLRFVHSPPTASILASVIPIAGLLTFFLFGFAERRQWTNRPGLLLLAAGLFAGILQFALGWQLANALEGKNLLPSFLETALVLLMLAAAHACCMNLLNHLAVANLGSHAYSARAAGSAGYMVAIIATAAILSDEEMVRKYHLYLAACCAAAHVLFVLASLLMLKSSQRPKLSSHASEQAVSKSDQRRPKADSNDLWRWRALIVLVSLTSFCEGAFGLYSHEFLTTHFGDLGYYLFAVCILLETILLLSLPFLPKLRKQLLFVGPLGWFLLLVGCLIAQAGLPIFGTLALAMAMNCPFQVSCNENAHAMRPKVTGLAAIALAQTVGVFCAQWASAILNRFAVPTGDLKPWTILWGLSVGVAIAGLVLAVTLQRKRPC